MSSLRQYLLGLLFPDPRFEKLVGIPVDRQFMGFFLIKKTHFYIKKILTIITKKKGEGRFWWVGRVTANQYFLIDCSMDTDCSFIFTDETLTATANAKYLSSPGYPTQYPK